MFQQLEQGSKRLGFVKCSKYHILSSDRASRAINITEPGV